MKKKYLLLILLTCLFGNAWGQSGEWAIAMRASLYNNHDFNAGRQSDLNFFLAINGGGYGQIAAFELDGFSKNSWGYWDVAPQTYSLGSQVTGMRIYAKLDKSGGGDPDNGNKDISFKTDKIIAYRHYRYCDDQGGCTNSIYIENLYRPCQGYLDIYVYPKNVKIVYKSDNPTDNFLPSTDKIKIEAPSGYDSSVYKWVYSSTNDASWKPVNNTSLQGKQTIEISGEDVYGADFETQMAASKNTLIALEFDVYKNNSNPSVEERSNILTLVNQYSAPRIVSVETASPLCHGEATGKLKIKFDRALYSGEKLYVSLKGNRFTESNTIAATIDPVTLETDYFTGLQADIYDISLYGTYTREGSSETVNTYTQGPGHTYTATVPDRPALKLESLTKQDVHCKSGTDGKILVQASGGVDVFDVILKKNGIQMDSLRFNGGQTAAFENLETGTYTVHINDTNGCNRDEAGQEVSGTILVGEPADPVSILDWDFEEPKGYGLSNGTAQIRFSGGTTPYSVVWENEAGTVITPNTTTLEGSTFVNAVENLTSGRYYVTVKDQNYTLADPQTETNNCGCTDTIRFFIPQPPGLGVEVQQQRYVTCYGDSDGALVAYAGGGRPFESGLPYTYQWYQMDGSTATLINGSDSIRADLPSGYYKVKITDSNAIFTESAVFFLDQPDLLTVTTQVLQNNTCNGDASGIIEAFPSGGVPPYTYFWSTGETTKTITGLPQGRYSVEVRDARYTGIFDPYCSATTSDTITSPASVTIKTLKQEPVHCYGGKDGKIVLEAGGGLTGVYTAYLRQNGVDIDSITFNKTQTAVFENLEKGAYNIFIKDENGCLVNLSDHPSLGNITVTEPAEKVTIAGYSVVEPLGAGLSNGYAQVVFSGGTAPYTAEWEDETGRVISSNAITTEELNYISKAENLKTGTYFVTIKDANYSKATPSTEINRCGCMDTIRFFVPEPPRLEVAIQELHYVTCYGDQDGSIVAHAQGGRPHWDEKLPYTYEWYKIMDDNQTETIAINDSIITDLYSGYYKVKITDRNGIWLLSDAFRLVQPEPLLVTTRILQNTICSGDSIGIIEASATGGTPPYNYIWSTNDTIPIVRGLPQGYYVVGVRDARYRENLTGHYCFAQTTDSIISPNSIRINAQVKHPVCNGYANGEITLNVTGGLPPYQYLWEDNSLASARHNLPKGTFRVKVTDANGCFMQETFELEEPAPVIVNLGAGFTLCKNQSITVDGAIGMEGVNYSWTDKEGNVLSHEPAFTVSKAGVYRLTAITSQGCTGTGEIIVSQSADEVIPDFVIATQVVNNTTIYAVDITRSVVDSIAWIIPENVIITNESPGRVELLFTENGFYLVGMTAYSGLCQNTLYKTVSVVDAMDIPEDNNEEPFLKRFVVSPNPNAGNFEALVELREPADYKLYLYDSNGKQIEVKEIKNRQYEWTAFNLSGITSGIYYLKFVSKETSSVFKIIIQ
ncbi:MAG: T9SS type A sorting domain-containing protein [Candidatus Symbiothrix sp.]|jgi:hypothetical protein|nr:T9SS type A sorting domain-containing protein [Candidatus Symbiothrix sp.]